MILLALTIAAVFTAALVAFLASELRSPRRRVSDASPASARAVGSRRSRDERHRLPGGRFAGFAVLLAGLAFTVAGCGGGQPRTVVLRSTSPPTSDIYIRITGPGGAVSYLSKRFTSSGIFAKYNFAPARPRAKVFLPPEVLEQKLCGSTHIIRSGEDPALQKWRGRTLAISIYGKKISRVFCALLGRELYFPDG